MSATPFVLPGTLPASPIALIIEPVLEHLLIALSAVSSIGFDVTVAETFKDAKNVLGAFPHPALLLTGVRLREYNGLHLVLRGKAIWPALAAVVTATEDDPVLRTEAERLGATFVAMPASREEIAAAVVRTALRSTAGGTAQDPIRPPFERRHAERRLLVGGGCAHDRRVADRRHDPAEALRQRVGHAPGGR